MQDLKQTNKKETELNWLVCIYQNRKDPTIRREKWEETEEPAETGMGQSLEKGVDSYLNRKSRYK